MIRVKSAIGGSTMAPVYLNAMARHIGFELTLTDWEEHGADVPLLVNLQPAGEYLGEDYYHAGGVPAVLGELLRAGLLDGSALTAHGRSVAENVGEARSAAEDVIRPCARPRRPTAGVTGCTAKLLARKRALGVTSGFGSVEIGEV